MAFDARKDVRYNKDKGAETVTAISITKARTNLYQTTADATLYLNSIPGMTESIIEAGKEPIKECTTYDPDEEW